MTLPDEREKWAGTSAIEGTRKTNKAGANGNRDPEWGKIIR